MTTERTDRRGHDHSHDHRGASKRSLLVALILIAGHMGLK